MLMNNFDKNIVFIGMPGSGKTTIGSMVSKELHRDFYDIDEYIEERYGKTISEIFKNGEEYFRKAETEAVTELSKLSPVVIATGGGVIKKEQNIEMLKQKGIIFFIDRKVSDIASDINMSIRPLLKDGKEKLFELYEERYKLYESYCDLHIKNEGKIEDAVEDIIAKYKSCCK